MHVKAVAIAVVAAAGLATSASAQVFTLTAVLSGAQEVGPVITPATGTATITIDIATRVWTMDLVFAGLTTPVTVGHIHRAPAGVNGPVIIGLDGLPLSGGRPSWALFAPGVTSFSSGGPLVAPFLFPLAEVNNLLSGQTYVNVHSQAFPGGEIRGQILPAPSAFAVMGLAGLVATRRRR